MANPPEAKAALAAAVDAMDWARFFGSALLCSFVFGIVPMKSRTNCATFWLTPLSESTLGTTARVMK
jgi:hypothetical protein